MKKQVIKKGKHGVRFFDRYFGIYPTRENEKIHIHISGPGLNYDHGNDDQYDWNKLPAGDYFDWFNPHGKTAMMAWRKNLDTRQLDITPYYHNILDTTGYKKVGHVPGYVNEQNIISVPIIDGTARIGLDKLIVGNNFSWDFYSLDSPDHKLYDSVEFEDIGRFRTRGNAWFGGNLKATDKLKFSIIIM